ncbi:hypothetical protein ACHQM5_001516 [Ranunculus cassubicifolius]
MEKKQLKRKASINEDYNSDIDEDLKSADDDDDSNSDDFGDEFGDEDSEYEKEAQKDDELEQLEKQVQSLRHGEQDILSNIKRHAEEDLLKSQAVLNQKVIWDRTLEQRILLQNIFSSSNKLPQGPIRASFCSTDDAVGKAYSEVINSSVRTLDSLVELQEALLEKNPSIKSVTEGTKKTAMGTNKSSSDDKQWARIEKLYSRFASFRDTSIDKWQRKSQVTTGVAGYKGKLQAFGQNISEQVAKQMRDPSRIVKRMQSRRSTAGVLGSVPDPSPKITEENGNDDGDPELFEDNEFYQQLLKEFFESPTVRNMDINELKRRQIKKRKIVDRRASKCRKIRYHVHEKIVNFMAPEPMNLPDMAPILFDNLFGLKQHQKPTPVA